ncbi:hypothetical protein [Marinobacter sp. F3R08]|uniref:hypothetical protein n=1 Tax=Marinobacter sp. F3R08 TaxID=2841559 RepID=UPI001C090C0F|nr:hypothetical protein [Marinobacter sp. F3R08]MBU2953839.1 hypothetical protein [Marinobacter sp. F3R08]
MKHTLLAVSVLLLLSGCQSRPPTETAMDSDSVYLSARHCLNEYLDDLDRVHYGPCLKIININGEEPLVREDGFIELPLSTSLTLGVSCVYRHANGSPIPATMETADFPITGYTFTQPGLRWYLHAHEQARHVVGCQPTLSRSVYPTLNTD